MLRLQNVLRYCFGELLQTTRRLQKVRQQRIAEAFWTTLRFQNILQHHTGKGRRTPHPVFAEDGAERKRMRLCGIGRPQVGTQGLTTSQYSLSAAAGTGPAG